MALKHTVLVSTKIHTALLLIVVKLLTVAAALARAIVATLAASHSVCAFATATAAACKLCVCLQSQQRNVRVALNVSCHTSWITCTNLAFEGATLHVSGHRTARSATSHKHRLKAALRPMNELIHCKTAT
jgi:hypothetical protein